MEKQVLIPISEDQFFAKVKDIVQAVIQIKEQQEFQEKLLSPAEACKLFTPSISKVALHRWTKNGLIPVHRIGGRIFYKQSEVIEAAKTVKKYDRNKTAVA
jgi:hypothetical protein